MPFLCCRSRKNQGRRVIYLEVEGTPSKLTCTHLTSSCSGHSHMCHATGARKRNGGRDSLQLSENSDPERFPDDGRSSGNVLSRNSLNLPPSSRPYWCYIPTRGNTMSCYQPPDTCRHYSVQHNGRWNKEVPLPLFLGSCLFRDGVLGGLVFLDPAEGQKERKLQTGPPDPTREHM